MILWIWNWVDIRRPNCNEILVTSGSKQCSSILSGKRAHTVVVYISYFGGNNSSDGAWFESQRWKSNRLFQNWHHGFFLMENGLESGISFLNSNAFSKTRTFLLLGDFMSSHQWAKGYYFLAKIGNGSILKGVCWFCFCGNLSAFDGSTCSSSGCEGQFEVFGAFCCNYQWCFDKIVESRDKERTGSSEAQSGLGLVLGFARNCSWMVLITRKCSWLACCYFRFCSLYHGRICMLINRIMS